VVLAVARREDLLLVEEAEEVDVGEEGGCVPTAAGCGMF
jgi:hypothetical protein